ncbi:hypothetical protein DFO55_10163 [Grimontella sp. AG753]|nr:hypothetical protein DFO55_10163 [Grimontella sp. AG753]
MAVYQFTHSTPENLHLNTGFFASGLSVLEVCDVR